MNRNTFAFIFSVLAITLLYYSCKKEKNATIAPLLASGSWQLASAQVTSYTGDTQDSLVKLDSGCVFKQIFTFKADNTCTFTNYHCQESTTTGNWSLSNDRLFLISDIAFQDTTVIGKARVFENSRIVNLGQYSLVLEVGDIQTNYGSRQKRRIARYGFIRQKTQ
ncbi:hypothetical protein GCM10023149_50930 [Mucilaginibacter gynuensis]|uniref:Lipocalin-like domain-containing protein n=1 Tax=Mucilaginibacter gynuensis TaxID=1302236 RepID=A0ABP8HJ61_9SPHI